MSRNYIYAGPEGAIWALSDGTGYRAEDDGGDLDGTFRTITDAYAAIGAVPPQYPIAPDDVRVLSEPDHGPAVEACPHCDQAHTDAGMRAHLDPNAKGAVRCAALYGESLDALAARARALRERDRA